jgi:two-component system cell cycle sensor histidine kinase/response regulator CckA
MQLPNPSATDCPRTEPASPATTVLIVEDEMCLRTPVTKILISKGFRVIEAADGRTALECFRERQAEIDVILLDMTLPQMSGPEVFEELRALRQDVRVVFTSAYDEEAVMKAVGCGAPWAYIQKPYRPSDLANLLRMVCLPEGKKSSSAQGA